MRESLNLNTKTNCLTRSLTGEVLQAILMKIGANDTLPPN